MTSNVFEFTIHALSEWIETHEIATCEWSNVFFSVSRWMSSNWLKLNTSNRFVFHSGIKQISFVDDDIVSFGYRIVRVHTVIWRLMDQYQVVSIFDIGYSL